MTDKRSDGAPSGDEEAPSVPNLLPANFAPSTGEKIDPVDIARADRTKEARDKRRAKARERNHRRQARKNRELRLLRLDKIATALVVAVVVAAPLAIGAVHLVTIVPLAAVALSATLCALVASHFRRATFKAGWLGWTLIGLTAFTFLQAAPLPLWMIELLSPAVGEKWRTAYEAAGSTASTATLSLHAGEASRAGFGLLTASAVYLASYNLFQAKERFQKMLLVLPILGVVLVAIGIAQKLLETPQRLFFYSPKDIDHAAFFASTFVNPNHLGALLGMIAFIPLGLSTAKDYRHYRGGLVLLFAVCVAGMVMSLSTTALLAFLVGLLAFGALILRRKISGGRSVAWVSLATIAAMAMGAYTAWSQLADKLSFLAEHQGLAWVTPTYLWGGGVSVIHGHPVAGVGRGGFEDAFASIPHPYLPGRFAYVNNTYLQYLADYGVIVGLVVIAVVTATVLRLGVRRGWKASDLPLMTGLFGGFVFLGFEAALSYSLDIPGVLLPAVFMLGLAGGRDARYRDLFTFSWLDRFKRQPEEEEDEGHQDDHNPLRRRARPFWRRALPAIALLGVAAAAAPGVSAALSTATGAPHNHLRSVATDATGDPANLDAAYRAAVEARPAYGPTHLAAALGFDRNGDAVRAARSLELAHSFDHWNPAPVLVDARMKRRNGKTAEALDAYREALHLSTFTSGPGRDAIALEIATQFSDPARIAGALPADDGEVWGNLLRSLLAKGRSDLVTTLGERLAVNAKDEAARRVALTWVARSSAERGDWELARKAALPLIEGGGPAAAHVVLVQAELEVKNEQGALTRAEAGLREHPNDTELLFSAASILVAHRAEVGLREDTRTWTRRVDRLMETLKPFVIRQRELRHRYYMLSGRYNRDRGRLPTAIADFRKAAEAEPSDPEPLVDLAELLEQDKQTRAAAELYALVLDRFPAHPRAPEFAVRLVELRERINTLDRFRNSGQLSPR